MRNVNWMCPLALLGLIFAVDVSGQHAATSLEAKIAQAVEQAITNRQTPGAVVLVTRLLKGSEDSKPLIFASYGNRSVVPIQESMTRDTVFDMASLTKSMVTATCIMKLVEMGKIKVTDLARTYLLEFGQNGKESITIEQLLLHTSGLIADNAQKDYEGTRLEAFAKIDALKLIAPPGARFIYSDVGYIVLGRIVEKVTGQTLDKVAKDWIFSPLEMHDSGFSLGEELRSRCAPTEKNGHDLHLRGVVHDPRARALGGVAGHAGLFSTATDVGKYAEMMLNQGTYRGKVVLRPETVRLMTQGHFVPGGGLRNYGWDMDTGYSAPRGDGFPVGLSYGHTGFTGTSLWIDPTSRTAVIILSNRVHPEGKGNVTPLRRIIANLVAEHLRAEGQTLARSPVRVGIDVLRRDKFALLKDKRVGLVTNHTGVARDGLTTIDILHQAENVKLTTLFSPEHGIRGALDEKVADGRDEKTGLPIYSLYGEKRKPTPEQLKDVDVLVYDIQDIGCRFYTFISTLGLVLEAAAENKLKVVVLDRPNPIGGVRVEGPMLDAGAESFVGYHRMPVRHGMTVGELARLFNEERKIKADLSVVKMEGWQRGDEYDRTGLVWINPSPNMRCLQAALLYPGVGLLETTNVSVGRGTDRPFEIVGAPWVDAVRWARELQAEKVLGVRFMAVRFTPTGSVHAKQSCQGVHIIIDDWKAVKPLQVGYALAVTLKRLFPEWQSQRYLRLMGNQKTLQFLQENRSVGELMELWERDPALTEFLEVRKRYLLYGSK